MYSVEENGKCRVCVVPRFMSLRKRDFLHPRPERNEPIHLRARLFR